MSAKKQQNKPELGSERQESWDEKVERFKFAAFDVMHVHLRETIASGTNAYRCIVALEQLSLLAFVLHPVLQVYGDVAGAQPLQTVLTALNFHEFLRTNSSLATPLVAAVFGFLLLQLAVIAVSALGVVRRWKWEYLGLLRKAAHFLFLLTAKALAGPFLALSITVLYCSSSSPYHAAQQCYAGEHLAQAAGAAVAVLLVGVQVLLFGLLYFVRDPLAGGYLCEKNHFYVLSKTLMKLLFPLYFALDSARTFEAQFLYAAAALWAVYLFWHRLNSLHSYDPRHYLFEYTLEAVVFWAAVKNIILLYTADGPLQSRFGLLSTFVEGGMLGSVLAALERWLAETRLRDGVRKKIKKQQFEPFFVSLVSAFVHETSQKAAVWFDVYSKLLGRDKALEEREKLRQTVSKSQEGRVKRVQDFLRQILKEWLKEKDSFLLRCAEVHLLAKAGQKHYALFRALELGTRKNSLGDQFALFALRAAAGLSEDSTRRNPDEFLRVYRYHRESELFEDLVLAAARNNFDFWEELSESEPSLSRVCGLAARYCRLEQRIVEQYILLSTIKENVYRIMRIFFEYHKNVGINTKQHKSVRDSLQSWKNSNMDKSQSSRNGRQSILTVGCVGTDLGIIYNCNSQATRLLNYTTEALLGKNVSKMMPEVFSKLHHLFLFNFISTNHDFSRTVEKVVPAMTRDSLIVEILLRIKLLYYRQGEMIFVGMMQKLNEDKGFIMFEADTFKIMGINSTLMKMMNNKLTGLQVVREEVNMGILFPDLDLQELMNLEPVITILDVNSLNYNSLQGQTRLNVLLQVKEIFTFQSTKLGFLVVEQNMMVNYLSIIGRSSATELNLESYQQTLKKLHKSNIKGQFTFKEKALVIIKSTQQQILKNKININYMNLQIEEFIKNKSPEKVKIAAIFSIILIISVCIFCTGYHTRHFSLFLNFTEEIYLQSHKMFILSEQQSNINSIITRLWSITSREKNKNSQYLLPFLNSSITRLGEELFQARRYLESLPESKESFSFHQITNFTIVKLTEQTIVYLNVTTLEFDGFYLYSSAAQQFLTLINGTITDFISLQLQQQSLFIHINSQEKFPSILVNTIEELRNYLKTTTIAFLKDRFILLTAAMFSIAVFIGIMALLIYFIKTNSLAIINLVNQITQEEAFERQKMCSSFLESISQPLPNCNPRISEHIGKTGKEKSAEKNEFQEKGEKEKIFQLQEPESSLNENIESEETRLKQQQSEKTVNLYYGYSTLPLGLIALTTILSIIASLIFLQQYSQNSLSAFSSSQEEYNKAGYIKQSLGLSYYFSCRLFQNPNNTAVRTLLATEINLFFGIKFSSEMLTHMEPILMKAYAIVQIFQIQLESLSDLSSGVFVGNLTKVFQDLKAIEKELDNLQRNTLYPQFLQTKQNNMQIQIWSIYLGIIFISLFQLILYRGFISSDSKQNKQFVNLIKMIPRRTFLKNKRLRSLILIKQRSKVDQI